MLIGEDFGELYGSIYIKDINGSLDERTFMRIKLTLEANRPVVIPINYQYPLSSAIYNMLQRADARYAGQLHEKGYELGSKKFKLFTFSSLYPDFYKLQGRQMLIAPGNVDLYIGSLKNEFLINFAEGVFCNNVLRISTGELMIRQAEAIRAPEFKRSMRFRCLSPVVATTKEEVDGQLRQRDCRLEEDKYRENIIKNLYSKYELIYGKSVEEKDFRIFYNSKDMERYGRGKLIGFKNSFIKGFLCPFEASGSPELMRVMWEVGAGEKNSGGFGMVDIA